MLILIRLIFTYVLGQIHQSRCVGRFLLQQTVLCRGCYNVFREIRKHQCSAIDVKRAFSVDSGATIWPRVKRNVLITAKFQSFRLPAAPRGGKSRI